MHQHQAPRQQSLEGHSKRGQDKCKLNVPADGDIYGSEGQYIRYEEGNWDEAYDEQYQDVSSGQPFANPRGRSGSARPAQSYGADRYSGDNMAGPDAAYITPETTAPLQAAGQVCFQRAPPLPSAQLLSTVWLDVACITARSNCSIQTAT